MNYYRSTGPWESNAERLVTEALQVGNTPGAELAQIRPPLPQIQFLPPRFGYGDAVERTPTLDIVLGAYRYYPDNKDALSGGTQEINSSSGGMSIQGFG